MNLYLASMGIPNRREFLNLLSEEPKNAPMAFIPNGKDGLSAPERDTFIQNQINMLGSLGIEQVSVLDLREYTAGNGNGLKQVLRHKRGLWIGGGETFALRHLMRVSGLEDELPDALQTGDLMYGGYSAPAIIAGATLDGFNLQACDNAKLEELFNDPTLKGKVIMEGLNLAPFKRIIPHFGNPDFAPLTEGATALLGQTGVMPLTEGAVSPTQDTVPLTDDQVLIGSGGNYRIATRPQIWI